MLSGEHFPGVNLKVRRVLSIDEIYDAVKGYDIVLTAEAALADALNGRIDRPKIGKLAYTPRNLTTKYSGNDSLKGKRELFVDGVKSLNLSWKEISFLLDKIVSYWKEKGDLSGLTRETGLSGERASEVLGLIQNTESIYRQMENYRIPEDRDVCLVAPYQFDNLDFSIVPRDHDSLSVFADDFVDVSEFKVYDTAGQLVGAAVDSLEKIDPEGAAVVVHPDSEYNPLLRSQLRARDISFQAADILQEQESLKTLLRFFRFSIRGRRVRLGEAESILKAMGVEVPREREAEYLDRIDISGVRNFYELIEGAREGTFGAIISALEKEGLHIDRDVKNLIEEIDLSDKRIGERNLKDLEYYLDSFPLEVDSDSSGLLLADPRSAAFVDRAIVFFLGMTTCWDQSSNGESWRDVEQWRRRKRRNFKALIQNGSARFYMVEEMKLNKEVVPSTYFNELKPDFTSFTEDEVNYERYERTGPQRLRFPSDFIDVEPEPVSTVSQTSLNRLAYCPRDEFFSRLVVDPDRDYFRKGNLFHDFAEFYANLPQFVEETGIARFVSLSVQRMESIVDGVNLDQLETEFRVGFESIMGFLREKKVSQIVDLDYPGYEQRKGENFFAKAFDGGVDRYFTEMDFVDESIGVRGKVDMLSGDEIVDYKSGGKKSAASVVRESNVELFEDRPNFQALLYISHHRSVLGESKIDFTFFHFVDYKGKLLRGMADWRDSVTTVSYYPYKFREFISRDDVFDYACGSSREKLLTAMGKEKFLQALSRLKFEDGNFYQKSSAEQHWEQLESICRENLNVGHGAEYDLTENQLKKGVRSVLKTSLYQLRTRNYFKEDVDKFENFVARKLEELARWQKSRFPVGDNDLDEVNYPDLILSGEGR